MRARIFAEENKKWWTLAAVAFGLFMIMLDNTIVNVALPSIERSLHMSISSLEWIVTAYALSFGSLPVVSVEQPLGTAPTILMDNRGGMCRAVEHLITVHRRRRIAFVRGPATHDGAEQRYQGYLEALTRHGMTVAPHLVSEPLSSWEPEDAAAATTRILDGGPVLLPGGGEEILGAVFLVAGVMVDAAHRVGGEHELQRHLQRARRARAVPCLGPVGLELTRRFAGGN